MHPPVEPNMLPNRDVICISSIDWEFIWQGHQEIMSRLAKQGHRVLFIENTGIRSVGIRDSARLGKRLKRWMTSTRGFRQEQENIYVLSPVLLPFPYSKLACWLNEKLLLWDLKRWMRLMHFHQPTIWTFLPTPLARRVMKKLDPALIIYYCIDNFLVSTTATKKVEKSEKQLFASADLVFVTSHELQGRALEERKEAQFFPFGVNFEKFQNAETSEPDLLKEIPHPRLGYVGGLHKWLDIPLLTDLAKTRPDIQLVFVGPKQAPLGELEDLPNVHCLGGQPHDALPSLIANFDACMIPYRLADYTDNVYPTKTNEYLALGKPVISTPLKEIQRFNDRHGTLIEVADSAVSFGKALDAILANGTSPETMQQRIDTAQSNGWTVKLETMQELIDEAIEKRAQTPDDWSSSFLNLYRSGRNRLVRIAVGLGLIWALLFVSPVPWYLAGGLTQVDTPQVADAIVVFGGGVGESGEAGQGYEERVQKAVELYKAGFAPKIIFSSGYVRVFHETEVMRALAINLGVPESVIVLEETSANTYENVVNVTKLLRKDNSQSVLLVTSIYHTRRAGAVFKKQAPQLKVRMTPVENGQYYKRDKLTSFKQLRGWLHECVALILYQLRGWL